MSAAARLVRAGAREHAAISTTTGSAADRIKGAVNQAAGAMKRSVGRVTGNTRLEAEGTAQAIRGRTQTLVGEAKLGMREAAARARRGG